MPYGRPSKLSDPHDMDIHTDRDTRDIIAEGTVRSNFRSRSEFIRFVLRCYASGAGFSCLSSSARPQKISELVYGISGSA